MISELCKDITLQTVEFLKGYDRTNIGKTWLYHKIVEEHPEFLEQTTPSTIKRHITNALKKNGFKNTSKGMNWFVRE